jgi:hypothetical protein
MTEVPEHIQIKLQNAKDFIPKIMESCLKEATNPRFSESERISAFLGEMAQALRSALNYAMWDFSESNLKSRLSSDEYEKLRWSHDFPIEKDNESFQTSRSRILRHISSNFSNVYQFLEKAQSYHDTENHLWHLKTISNDTAHTIPIEAQLLQANDVAFIGLNARIFGNQVIISNRDGVSKTYSIPCFVYELNMFVSEKKKWVLFLIDIDHKRKPNLIPFIQTTNQIVSQLVSGFYALW